MLPSFPYWRLLAWVGACWRWGAKSHPGIRSRTRERPEKVSFSVCNSRYPFVFYATSFKSDKWNCGKMSYRSNDDNVVGEFLNALRVLLLSALEDDLASENMNELWKKMMHWTSFAPTWICEASMKRMEYPFLIYVQYLSPQSTAQIYKVFLKHSFLKKQRMEHLCTPFIISPSNCSSVASMSAPFSGSSQIR